MEKKNKSTFLTTILISLSLCLIGCNTSDEGGSPIAAQNDSVSDSSSWEEIIVDGNDYNENEEVPELPAVDAEFEYDSDIGECLNEDFQVGTNSDEQLLCGNYENQPLPIVELDNELPFGLDISGSFVSSEHKISIKDLIKYEVVINKLTYFEDRPNLLSKIKRNYEREIIRVLKRIKKWNKSNKKLFKAKSKLEKKLEQVTLLNNSKKEARIKKNLLRIKYKLSKIDTKQNRLQIKLKYLDKTVKEL